MGRDALSESPLRKQNPVRQGVSHGDSPLAAELNGGVQLQGRRLARPCLGSFPPARAPHVLLPVAVVQVLPDEGVGLHRPVGIHLRHVHVVDEVDQLLLPRGPIVSPCLLFQRLLQDS